MRIQLNQEVRASVYQSSEIEHNNVSGIGGVSSGGGEIW